MWVHRCVGSESARVHVHLLQISLTFPLADSGPLLKDFAVHLKHSRLQKVSFVRCDLTSVDVATLLAEGLSENRTLEQLQISLWMATVSRTVSLVTRSKCVAQCVYTSVLLQYCYYW